MNGLARAAMCGLAIVSSALVSAPNAGAAAVVTNNPLTCNATLYLGDTAVTASPGDTFQLDFMPTTCNTSTLTYDTAALSTTILSGAVINAGGDNPTTLTFTVLAGATSGAHNMTLTTGGTSKTIAVTVSGGSGGSPASWWKQYQRANREEVCRTGWNPTYGMWANGGRGGWTCVQELYYDGATWLTR